MEPTQKPTPRVTPKEDDVDLGQLFYKTGGVIHNFFSWLGRVLAGIGKAILFFLFYIRRNLVWLIAGTLLGLGIGFFLMSKTGKNYFSEITIRTNFNSSRSVYSSINFFNGLVSNRQHQELARIFRITPAEAATLTYFESSPVTSELITAEMYNQQFLNQNYYTRLRMDTFWIRTIGYEDFKSALTKYDYPVHQIKVTSTNAFIFPKIQQGLIQHLSNNELLRMVEENGNEMNRQEVELLTASIQSLDTLRSSYNKRLARSSETNNPGNNVTVLDGNTDIKNPELELYDKMLQLKDELKIAKNQAVMQKNIIQVYSSFGSIGQRVSIFEQKVVKFALIGLLSAFFITAFISFYKILVDLEKRYKKDKLSRAGISH